MVIAAHADLVAAVDRSERHVTATVDVDWWSDPGDNLIGNGDFEAGTAGWSGALGSYTTATVAQSATRAHSGTRSMLVTWPTTSVGSTASTAVATVVGRKYRLRTWLWVPAGAPQPQPFVFFLTAAAGGTSTGSWQLVELVFVATLTSHTVGLYVPAAAAGQQVWVDRAVCVPWVDLTPMAASTRVTRSLAAELPDVAGIASGDIAAQATVELSGVDPTLPAATPAAALLQPFNGSSPLWRRDRAARPMTVDIGLLTDTGERRVRRFTGRTRSVTVDAAAGTVTADGLDYAEMLRGPAELPAGVANALLDGKFVRPGLNAQWVVDLLLRRNGIYATPPIRPSCVLSATMHGSAYPEVGTLSEAYETGVGGGAVGFTHGRFALCTFDALTAPAPNPPISETLVGHEGWGARWFVDGAGLTSGVGDGILVEGWWYVNTPVFFPAVESDPGSGSRQKFDAVWGLSTLDLHWYTNAAGAAVTVTGPAVSIDDAWHYVALQVSFPTTTTIRCTFRIDGTSTTPADVAVTARTTQTPMTFVRWDTGGPMVEALQITSETPAGAAPFNDEFTPTAVLEHSLLELTVIPPAAAGATAWTVIKEIAAAEAAVCGFDEAGTFVYLNRRAAQAAPVRTVTAERSIEGFRTLERVDSVRNRIRVPVTGYQIQPSATVWQLPQVEKVPRRGTLTIIAEFAGPVLGLSTDWTVIPTGGGGADSGYRAARNPDGGGGAVSNLTATITALGTTAALVEVRNPNSFDAYLVSPTGAGFPPASDGLASARLRGSLITDLAAATDTTDVPTIAAAASAEALWQPSIDRVGDQPYDVPTSVWRQQTADAQALADDLLALLYLPAPVFTQVTIAGDPTLQLGDRIVLSDPHGSGLDDPVVIVGVGDQVDDEGGYTQTLTVRAVAPPGTWILGYTGRAELGTTTRL